MITATHRAKRPTLKRWNQPSQWLSAGVGAHGTALPVGGNAKVDTVETARSAGWVPPLKDEVR